MPTLNSTLAALLRPAFALGGWLWLLMGGVWVMGIALTLKPKTRTP